MLFTLHNMSFQAMGCVPDIQYHFSLLIVPSTTTIHIFANHTLVPYGYVPQVINGNLLDRNGSLARSTFG
jgi:hypothetical protein